MLLNSATKLQQMVHVVTNDTYANLRDGDTRGLSVSKSDCAAGTGMRLGPSKPDRWDHYRITAATIGRAYAKGLSVKLMSAW